MVQQRASRASVEAQLTKGTQYRDIDEAKHFLGRVPEEKTVETGTLTRFHEDQVDVALGNPFARDAVDCVELVIDAAPSPKSSRSSLASRYLLSGLVRVEERSGSVVDRPNQPRRPSPSAWKRATTYSSRACVSAIPTPIVPAPMTAAPFSANPCSIVFVRKFPSVYLRLGVVARRSTSEKIPIDHGLDGERRPVHDSAACNLSLYLLRSFSWMSVEITMNVLQVLLITTTLYFITVGLWVWKIEDILEEGSEQRLGEGMS